jgi:hypothetical protein
MDQDFGYDDLVAYEPKKQKKSKPTGGQRAPLLTVLILLLVMVLLVAGGYFLWSRPELLSFLPQPRPAPTQELAAAATLQPPAPTEAAATAVSIVPPPTPTSLPPTEIPPEPAPEAILPLPEYGTLVQTRAGGGDQEERALALANDTAVREPYTWEYLEFEPGTLIVEIERYYITLINKELGYRMTFNEKFPSSALAIFKFKQDERRITIQFFEGLPDRTPAAYLFYEGW